MLVLGLPVMDGHDLTQRCVAAIADTVLDRESFGLVTLDNGSEKPYTLEEFGELPFRHSVMRFSSNRGYYQPLGWMANAHAGPGDLVALMHNDVLIYEHGWDRRLREAFVAKPDLGMVGFFGSDQVDDRGGRGGGSMSNFNGKAATPAEAHGRRINDLRPALVLDSLFMATRVPCVPALAIDAHTPICHFMDKVWPLRLIDSGSWKVAVLGIDIDHIGGQTAVAMPRFEEEARRWCVAEGITSISTPSGSADGPGGMALYLEAERRFLTEMRAKALVPSRMVGWNVLFGR